MQIQPNTFICADSMEVLREIPNGFCDLCLTDPPYGHGKKWSGGTWASNEIYDAAFDWDAVPCPPEAIQEIRRVSKQQIVWGGNYYGLSGRCWLAWEKLEKMDTLADFELAWTSFDAPAKRAIFRRNHDGKREHPTQKPVPLFVWCLLKFSQPGDLVIDPFCGSGTTALACHKTGRRFICIDREQKYIDIAQQRYRDLIAQTNLFEDGALETVEGRGTACNSASMQVALDFKE